MFAFVVLMNLYCLFYRVEYVAEGFFELVTDDSKNGAVLAMSKGQGKTYVPV